MSQKVIDILTEIALLVLAFTAGVAVMYQITLHQAEAVAINVSKPVAEVADVALSAEPAKETGETDSEPMTVSEMIVAEADNADIDPELALAIARLETGHFTSDAYQAGNNVGGMSVDEVPMSFSTLEGGVAAYIECLKTYYAAGLTTPEEIGKHWCPVNPEWAATVETLMREA
jgi:hypothetical protein